MRFLAVIIVNYNSAFFLNKSLEILLKDSFFRETEFIIIDNGEKKNGKRQKLIDCFDPLIQKDARVKVFINKRNLGYGVSNNKGALKTKRKYILFLNPDCIISGEDVEKLVKAIKTNKNCKMVAPTIIQAEKGAEQQWSYEKGKFSGRVRWVTGACFLMKRKNFQGIGGFDKNFFLYFEDRDLCLRVRKRGGIIVRETRAKAKHLESKSRISWKKRKKLYYVSQNYYFKKHYGILAMLLLKTLRFPLYVKNIYFAKE
jgi:GT2 family glycosyltransferase